MRVNGRLQSCLNYLVADPVQVGGADRLNANARKRCRPRGMPQHYGRNRGAGMAAEWARHALTGPDRIPMK